MNSKKWDLQIFYDGDFVDVKKPGDRRAYEMRTFPQHLRSAMKKNFKIGDHVEWNSEAGRVSGHIVKVLKAPTKIKGYTHHASKEEPQYMIKSDKTDHVAVHKGSALKKLSKD